ncbi:MAG TPA: hypothetical protein VJW55_17020 [Candidatus Angelobacter sp.]|jgi:hypothetical protein|nr:hypothetical protein [Candidatus Angelobacter sp.]
MKYLASLFSSAPCRFCVKRTPESCASNFARDRIYPTFQLNASAGVDIYKSERVTTQLQVDGQNLTNVFNVIDSNGLLSGNAIGPSRSYQLRLTTNF